MGKRYHLSDDGPRECKAASPETCRISSTIVDSSTHFTDPEKAQTEYENQMNSIYDDVKTFDNGEARKRKSLSERFSKLQESPEDFTVEEKILPMKHGSYYGSEIPVDSVEPILEQWRNVIGDDSVDMEEKKSIRDGGKIYHVTVLDPRETRKLKKTGKLENFMKKINKEKFSYESNGIGTAFDNDNEAHYIVVNSESIQKLREDFNLGRKDLHITIGFKEKDIHGVPKNSETRIFKKEE